MTFNNAFRSWYGILAVTVAAAAAAVVLLRGGAVAEAADPPSLRLTEGAPGNWGSAARETGDEQERLRIRVVYPPAGSAIAASDSNFIFGSVSSPRAKLTVNGFDVPVHPNGAFLAWLPVPPRSQPNYELIASVGSDTARVVHAVQLPSVRPIMSMTGPLVVDSGSVTPRLASMLWGDEVVRVSVRAPANAQVSATVGGVVVPLTNGAVLPTAVLGGGVLDTAAARTYGGDPLRWSTGIPARFLLRGGRLTVSRGRDTVSFALPPISAMDSVAPLYVMIGAMQSAVSDTDRVVIARPSPGGTYKWLLFPGTIVELTGREGDFARIRLDSSLDVWVPLADVQLMPPGFVPPRALPQNSRLVSTEEWVDLVVPMGERVPFAVESFDDRIELTLYGVRANLDNIIYPSADSLVRVVTTTQESSDRARITLRTAARPFGYQTMFEGRNMILRVRRPPTVQRGAPLRGLTIAVDAGHPPAGSTGPTGLYEGEVNLAIAERLRGILIQRGAKVVMTRTTEAALDLALRPVIARRANAHAMVSIHMNALPDGINPFVSHGTSTYYFQETSVPLAREVQGQLLRRLGLRDLGYMYNTFAVTRPTWMPTVLCEGAFIMIPEQEAAARTPAFQVAYATAVADGLQRYFASLAR